MAAMVLAVFAVAATGAPAVVARTPVREGFQNGRLLVGVDASLEGVTVLPFGELEGAAYARIRAAQVSVGGHAVATRNVKDFEGAGITVIDPWSLPAN